MTQMTSIGRAFTAYLKTKGEISKEERALIDEALNRGKVTVVPKGVSGFNNVMYDHQTGRLVYKESQHWSNQNAKAQAKAKLQQNAAKASAAAQPINDARKAEGKARLAKFVGLLKDGHSIEKAGAAVGWTIKTAKTYRKKAVQLGMLPYTRKVMEP